VSKKKKKKARSKKKARRAKKKAKRSRPKKARAKSRPKKARAKKSRPASSSGGGKKRRAPSGGLDMKAIARAWKQAGKPGRWIDFVKANRHVRTGGGSGAGAHRASTSSAGFAETF
jgi:hypothetical protein